MINKVSKAPYFEFSKWKWWNQQFAENRDHFWNSKPGKWDIYIIIHRFFFIRKHNRINNFVKQTDRKQVEVYWNSKNRWICNYRHTKKHLISLLRNLDFSVTILFWHLQQKIWRYAAFNWYNIQCIRIWIRIWKKERNVMAERQNALSLSKKKTEPKTHPGVAPMSSMQWKSTPWSKLWNAPIKQQCKHQQTRTVSVYKILTETYNEDTQTTDHWFSWLGTGTCNMWWG